jgi:hypothetical protein
MQSGVPAPERSLRGTPPPSGARRPRRRPQGCSLVQDNLCRNDGPTPPSLACITSHLTIGPVAPLSRSRRFHNPLLPRATRPRPDDFTPRLYRSLTRTGDFAARPRPQRPRGDSSTGASTGPGDTTGTPQPCRATVLANQSRRSSGRLPVSSRHFPPDEPSRDPTSLATSHLDPALLLPGRHPPRGQPTPALAARLYLALHVIAGDSPLPACRAPRDYPSLALPPRHAPRDYPAPFPAAPARATTWSRTFQPARPPFSASHDSGTHSDQTTRSNHARTSPRDYPILHRTCPTTMQRWQPPALSRDQPSPPIAYRAARPPGQCRLSPPQSARLLIAHPYMPCRTTTHRRLRHDPPDDHPTQPTASLRTARDFPAPVLPRPATPPIGSVPTTSRDLSGRF